MSKSYHFIGIGGIGMGGLAALLLARGHHVSGSDLCQNAITQKLVGQGAVVHVGHDARHIVNPDCVVVSSAISQDNPEHVIARNRGIPVVSRAKMLATLTEGFNVIAVAGAHGKTTTTSMVSHVLQSAGLEPTTVVGGIVNSFGSNSRWGQGNLFVIEADESDGSLLNFSPQYSMITNIDREHMDFYRDMEHILSVYRQFIRQTLPGGCLIACGDDHYTRSVMNEAEVPVLTYGRDTSNTIYPVEINAMDFHMKFSCRLHGEVIGPFDLPVPGEHNILNAMAVILLGKELGISENVLRDAFAGYQGVRRRFQQVGMERGILIVDDYAHHPTEIQATLKAANAFDRRKVVVFQPHRYSRFRSLYDDFLRCWDEDVRLIVTDIYAAGERPVAELSAQGFVDDVSREGHRDARYVPRENLVEALLLICKEGDLLLTLGAGDVTAVGYQFQEALMGSAVQ
jgi:UDP-N-acetylmuramate--alanine ligase